MDGGDRGGGHGHAGGSRVSIGRVTLSLVLFAAIFGSLSTADATPFGGTPELRASPCGEATSSTDPPIGSLQVEPPTDRLLYVTVIDSVTSQPIPDFVVEIDNSSGATVDRIVTDRSGRAVAELPPASYAVRVLARVLGVTYSVRATTVDLQDQSVRLEVYYSALVVPARFVSTVVFALVALALTGVVYAVLKRRLPKYRGWGALAAAGILVASGVFLVPTLGGPLAAEVPRGHVLVSDLERFVRDEVGEASGDGRLNLSGSGLHVQPLVAIDDPIPAELNGSLEALGVGWSRFRVEPVVVPVSFNAMMLHFDTDPDQKLHDAVNKMFDEFERGGMNMSKMKEVKKKTELHTPKNECAFLPSDADGITYFPGIQFVDWHVIWVYDGNTHVVLGADDAEHLKNGTFFGGGGWVLLPSTITAFHEMLHVKIHWEEIDAGSDDEEHALIDLVWSAAQNKLCIAKESNADIRDRCRTDLQKDVNKIKMQKGGQAMIDQLNLTAG